MMMMMMMTIIIMMCFLHPKRSQTQTASEGRTINYDADNNNNDDDDDEDDDDYDDEVFACSHILPSLGKFSQVYPRMFKSSQV